MSEFIQLHLLTSYPPSNLNRDDLGRPKTAIMGGIPRLRISSQSLKRAWRTSDLFRGALEGHIGTRTKRLGSEVLRELLDKGLPEKTAREAAEAIAGAFGKYQKPEAAPDTDGDSKKKLAQEVWIQQLVHLSPEELAGVWKLTERLVTERRAPVEEELSLLRRKHSAVDIALFGRMVAAAPTYSVEAAAQVAHAITVHRTDVEDDFFSAVDDLNRGREDLGAGHLGETEFGAGLFYLYLCIDRTLLVENLDGDEDLAQRALRALVESALKVAPSGKQSTFASRAYASYALVEKGRMQPRSLAVAFLEPIGPRDEGSYLEAAIARLQRTVANFDTVYGPTRDSEAVLDAVHGQGSAEELLAFVATPLEGQ
jgi:CRISPR system Cascade subunit CasC